MTAMKDMLPTHFDWHWQDRVATIRLQGPTARIR